MASATWTAGSQPSSRRLCFDVDTILSEMHGVSFAFCQPKFVHQSSCIIYTYIHDIDQVLCICLSI